MNKTIYRQYDSRWGSLAYPTKSSSFSGNGCGACSVLHCIIEQEKYAKWTPKDIQPYMKQHAVSGQGTTWQGIETALKHFGMKNVKWFKYDAKMPDVWAELNKGGRIGVILFSAGKAPDGTLWTAGGHYIAFTDYKVKNNKHYFYMKDSGQRKHDGWYCYETSMKGRVPQVWTCTVPVVKVDPPKEKTANEKCLDAVIAFAKKYADDNTYKYRKWSESNKYTHQCPLCHPESNKHATKGWNCRGLVAASLYHGGGVKTVECSCKGMGMLGKKFKDFTLANWKKYNGNEWTRVYYGKNLTSTSKLQRGDVLVYFNSDGSIKHWALYYGSGKVVDATSSNGIKVRKPSSYGRVVFRYTGKGKF